MTKKITILLMIFLLFVSTILPLNALDTTSESILLYDLENECILYEENSYEVRPIASLTKLLAIIVAIEEIDNLDEEITVDGDIISGYYEYTKVGFSHGNRVTYKDLLYGMMLPSGADAALLISHHVAGSNEAFASLMNKKAKEIGMANSCFDNSIGEDSENNYSTAADILKLLKYALKNETFYQLFTTKKYAIDHLDIEMASTLYYYTKNSDYDISIIEGSKTGFTNGAGYCLASFVKHDSKPVVLITLGADEDDRTSAIHDSLLIYNDFMSQYHYQEVLTVDQIITTLPVKLGWKKTYDVKMPITVYGFVKDKEALDIQFIGVPELNKDIKKGDYIGRVEVYQNGYLLTSYDLNQDSSVYYHYPLLYALIIVIMLLFILIQRKKKLKYKKRRVRRY